MGTFKASILLMATLVCISMNGQHKGGDKTLLMQLGTDGGMLANGTFNAFFGLRTQGFGLGVAVEYLYATADQTYFSVDHARGGYALHAGRYFTLHRTQSKGPGSVPCPAWGEQRRSRSNNADAAKFHGWALVHIGYRKDRWIYAHTGLPGTIANGTYYTFIVRNNGPLARVGYALSWWRLFMEVGATGYLSFPEVEGPLDPFGEALYTGTKPFRYRLDGQLDLRAGFQFPLYKH